MRSIITFLFLLCLLVGATYTIIMNKSFLDTGVKSASKLNVITDIPDLQIDEMEENLPVKQVSSLSGGLFEYIHKPSESIISEFGEPLRKDLSAYGYEWWVYTDFETEYIQFGVEDGVVKTIYSTGSGADVGPFLIGSDYDMINNEFEFLNKVDFNRGKSRYTFILNDEQIEMLPLIQLEDNLFVQCYFDTFTKKLSSVRITTGDLLLQHQFYELEYRGDKPNSLSVKSADWEQIEKGMERQILDISNMYRRRHRVAPLVQEPQVREVAYLHSKDMSDNQYFSHDRPDGTGLKERLAEKNIHYTAAGENIAAHYPDAPAVVEGWLNSEGHRKALLDSGYSHLGTGVYQLYYTQNFIRK